ncbi:MAG: DUF2232 domain-containing protein [Thermodesulfobacteriota bacterium]
MQMQQKHNQSPWGITAVSVALSVVLLLAAVHAGPLGAFIHLFLAVPVALAGFTSGIMAAVIVVCVSVAVQFAAAGHAGLVLYIAQYGIPGLVLVYALRTGIGWPRAVVRSTLVGAGLLLALAGYAASSADSTISALVADYIDAEMKQVHAVYAEAGVEDAQLEELIAVVEATAEFLKRAYAGITVAALGMVNMVTVMVLYIFGRGKFTLPGVDFHHFKASEPLIWILIAAGFCLLAPVPEVQDIALNVLTVLLPLYFVHGVAIVTFYFRKKAFSLLARIFAYTIMLVVNPLPLMVTALGVFDLWFDFRKPRVKTT